jgi:DNA-binding protein HU-beta
MAKQATVSKAQLVDAIAQNSDLKKMDVKTVVDNMIEQIATHLDQGTKVQLTGFGTFEVRARKARTGVKPGTTDRINIPESSYPAFKPGKGLKERIRGAKR